MLWSYIPIFIPKHPVNDFFLYRIRKWEKRHNHWALIQQLVHSFQLMYRGKKRYINKPGHFHLLFTSLYWHSDSMTFDLKLNDNALPAFQDVFHRGSILSFLRIPKERSCNCNSKEKFQGSLNCNNSYPDKYTPVPTLVHPVWCIHVKSKANKRICKADNHCEVNQATPARATSALTNKL